MYVRVRLSEEGVLHLWNGGRGVPTRFVGGEGGGVNKIVRGGGATHDAPVTMSPFRNCPHPPAS